MTKSGLARRIDNLREPDLNGTTFAAGPERGLQPVQSANGRMRIAMLVANPGSTDARVRKQAETLVSLGHDVTVFGTLRQDLPPREVMNGVEYVRATTPGPKMLPFFSVVARDYLFENRAFRVVVAIASVLLVLFLITAYAILRPTIVLSLPFLVGVPGHVLDIIHSIPSGLWTAFALLAACAAIVAVVFPRQVYARLIHYSRLAVRVPFRFAGRLARRSARFAHMDLPSAPRNYTSISSALWASLKSDRRHWDVVHSHDLNTLMAGVRAADRDGARLVFDAHEMATHEDEPHLHAERLFKRILMASLIKRVNKVITVSVGFARHFRTEYGVEAHVIYNTPIFPERSRLGRDIRSDLGLSADEPLCAYIGGINRRRASLELATAITLLPPNFRLAFVTNANQSIRDEIMEIVRASPNAANVHWLPTVPHDEVVHYVRTADLSLVTRKPPKDHVNIQREYSMPNKLFESALAGVPMVAGNSTEIREFLAQNGLGEVTDCSEPEVLAASIVAVYQRRLIYRKTGPELERIRQAYGWDNSVRVLKLVYGQKESVLGSSATGIGQ